MARPAPDLDLSVPTCAVCARTWGGSEGALLVSLCPSRSEGRPRPFLSLGDQGVPKQVIRIALLGALRTLSSVRHPRSPSALSAALGSYWLPSLVGPGSLLGHHMVATPCATVTSSSPLGVPGPPSQQGSLAEHTQLRPGFWPPVSPPAPQAPSPDPVPTPSVPGFLPHRLQGAAGGNSCVSDGRLMVAAPSCPSPQLSLSLS